MAQNKLSDLNNHLFAQLERLGDEEMDIDHTRLEIQRAKAIQGVSKEIIAGARLTFDVAKSVANGEMHQETIPGNLLDVKSKA